MKGPDLFLNASLKSGTCAVDNLNFKNQLVGELDLECSKWIKQGDVEVGLASVGVTCERAANSARAITCTNTNNTESQTDRESGNTWGVRSGNGARSRPKHVHGTSQHSKH